MKDFPIQSVAVFLFWSRSVFDCDAYSSYVTFSVHSPISTEQAPVCLTSWPHKKSYGTIPILWLQTVCVYNVAGLLSCFQVTQIDCLHQDKLEDWLCNYVLCVLYRSVSNLCFLHNCTMFPTSASAAGDSKFQTVRRDTTCTITRRTGNPQRCGLSFQQYNLLTHNCCQIEYDLLNKIYRQSCRIFWLS